MKSNKNNLIHYDIKNIDVSEILIRSVFEADEDNISEWFDSVAKGYFQKRIIGQVHTVDADDLIEHPLESNPVKDPMTGILTYYFQFHGADENFGDSPDEFIAYVVVLVNANSGQAYAIESEAV